MLAVNNTASFMALSEAWQKMTINWQGDSIKAFVGAMFSYLFGVQSWELLFILVIAICIDTFLGMAKAVKLKVFTARGMGKILYKVPLYGALLVMTHIAVNVVYLNGGVDLGVMDAGAYLFLILREMKGSTEKLTFFDIDFVVPIRAMERLVSRNSNESKTNGKDGEFKK